jgi:hypothetical protein
MTLRGRLACVLCGAALAVVCSLGIAVSGETPAPAPPLTNEDVVRMVSSGTPERRILEIIAARPEAYELADDMVDELRIAGVSEPVIAAMKRKLAESAPPSPPVDRPARGHVTIVVALHAGAAGARTLHVPGFADEDLKARLALPKENEQREVKDLAVFLACITPEHIPDLWRGKTPLGRDMTQVARHEMLAFVPGETPPGKPPRLTLPARIEGQVDEAETHELVLGVAARIGDRWFQLGAAKLANVTPAADAKPLSGDIKRVGRGFDFKIELTAP